MYNEFDVVVCENISNDNHEGLEVGAYYIVVGYTEIADDGVYAVRDMKGDLKYSIDRFRYVGRAMKSTDIALVGDKLLCVMEGSGDLVTNGKIYEVYSLEKDKIFIIGNDGNKYDLWKTRFVNLTNKATKVMETLTQNRGKIAVNTPEEIKNAIANKTEDVVNNPSHYVAGGIECIDYLQAKMSAEEFYGFLRGNVLKYMSRAGKKDEATQDYKKAQWYLNKLINELEGEVK